MGHIVSVLGPWCGVSYGYMWVVVVMGYTLILYLVVTLGMQAWQYYYISNVLTSDIFQLSLVVTTLILLAVTAQLTWIHSENPNPFMG